MEKSIERITQSIECAKKEGADAGAAEILILCADEAKNIECNIVHTLFKHFYKVGIAELLWLGFIPTMLMLNIPMTEHTAKQCTEILDKHW